MFIVPICDDFATKKPTKICDQSFDKIRSFVKGQAKFNFCPQQWVLEMRRSLLAILSLSCLITVVCGCRQTTSGINGSPLTPISPLAPNNSLFPAPSSNVGPMGGSTRVPPPSTGSIGTPNNYLGGANGQVNNPNNANGFAAVSPRDEFVGSGIQNGVQSAGWTETNTNLPNGSIAPAGFNDGQFQPHSNSFNHPAPNNQPASWSQSASLPKPLPGGMPVIDLTSAPNPPGYYPQQQPYPNSASYSPGGYPQPNYSQPGSNNVNPSANIGYGVPGSYPGANTTANGTFAQPNNAPVPSYDSQSFQSVPQSQNGFSGPPANQTFQGTSNQYRVPQQSAPALPSTQPRPATSPPVQQVIDATANDLLWRRPGAGY